MSIDEQPMNVYWSGKRTETNNNFKTNYKGSVATKNNLPNLGNKTGDMYNVAESGENFIWNGNSWDSLSGDTLKTLNWQKTEKAGAVTCWPVGGTELLPTVGFMFTEVPPASGDKGPDNPSTIAGVENIIVGRCGKNLYNIFETPKYPPALSEPDADGYIDFSVTNTSGSTQYYGRPQKEKSYILSEKTYTIVFEVASISSCAILLNMSSEYSLRGQLNTGYNLINSAGTHFIICSNNNIYAPNVLLRLTLQVLSGATASIKFRVSVFEGIVDSSNFEYVPYSGTDYPLSLNDTYYGGSVDLATGVMTVTWNAIALNGTESWVKESNSTNDVSVFRCAPSLQHLMSDGNASVLTRICTHFSWGTTVTANTFSTWGTNPRIFLRLPAASYPDTDSFTSWLTSENGAGHPVVVGYAVNTPYTVSLTPTQIYSLSQLDPYTPRLNTVYSDQTSVQVGYPKSPIRSEYELTQAIIATEGGE